MKNSIYIILTLISSLVLTACGLGDSYIHGLFSDNEANLPLFMDDFSDHNNDWKLAVTDKGVVHYDGDSIRILINEPNATYWTTPGLRLTDSVVDVDATKVSGPSDNLFGIICRFQDERNYYSLIISTDGYYGILKVQDGVRTFLGSHQMQVTDLVQEDGKINHLRADCVDDKLSLYVNWTKLLEVKDDTFGYGDVGILAATRDSGGTDIRFDNFIVINPE